MAAEAPGAYHLAWPGAAVEGYPCGRLSDAPIRSRAPVLPPHAVRQAAVVQARVDRPQQGPPAVVLTRRLFE